MNNAYRVILLANDIPSLTARKNSTRAFCEQSILVIIIPNKQKRFIRFVIGFCGYLANRKQKIEVSEKCILNATI